MPAPHAPAAVRTTCLRATAVVCAAVLVFGAAAWAGQEADPSKDRPVDLTVLRVCVAGAILTATSSADDVAPRTPLPATYRLTGPRGIVKQLKAHDGHYEEVTGRISGAFASPGGRQVGKIGSVGIVVGAGPSAQPNAPRVPEMPAFEVKSFRHLEDRCPSQ